MSRTALEMDAQFEALERTFRSVLAMRGEIRRFFASAPGASVHYLGCGSGYALCRSGARQLAVRTGRPASAWAAGDVLLHAGRYAAAMSGGLLVAPTRSGRTTEVVRAVEAVRAAAGRRVPLLSVVCATDTPVGALSDLCVELPWAFDESVCQTRSVSNLYLAQALAAAFVADDARLPADLQRAVAAGPGFRDRYAAALKGIAAQDWTEAVVLADGEASGLAAEGALAFLEIAGIAGRQYHVLDARHGPMATIGRKTLVLVLRDGEGDPAVRALIAETVSRGATVVACSGLPRTPVPGTALEATIGVALDPAAQALPFLYLAQALAVGKAEALGIDPDRPDGITAWVALP